MAKVHVHQTRDEIVKRLKRAEGHLGTVIGMIEQNSGAGRKNGRSSVTS